MSRNTTNRPTGPGPQAKSQDAMPRLHSSIPSHLSTELELLRGLINRSKFQHRSQPFLQRMKEVQRLALRVEGGLAASEGTPGENDMLRSLVPKLVHCLLRAAMSTQQIIELEHFLPTQISVLAIYGRLFALAVNIAQTLSLDIEEILAGTGPDGNKIAGMMGSVSARTDDLSLLEPKTLTTSTTRYTDFDFGQKIERPTKQAVAPVLPVRPSEPTLPMPSKSRSPSPSASQSPTVRPVQDSPDPDFPVMLPPSPGPKASSLASPAPLEMRKKKKRPKTEAEAGAEGSKKTQKIKKKRNDIDDIFG